VAVWNRTGERAQEFAEEFGVVAIDAPEPAQMLLNCTRVGLDERTSSVDAALTSLQLSTDLLARYAYVVDYVYSDRPSPLLSAAEELGLVTVDGLAILSEQGALSFELWTGRRAPRATMLHAAAGG
jgi:shikimate dehydrogenase